MRTSSAITKLMERSGFRLARKGKHCVWKNPEGATIITSVSPSDIYALNAVERDIRRAKQKRVA